MIGLWQTKVSGYMKDTKIKKTKFKHILKEKGRILRKIYRNKIVDKDLYYEDRFETIYKENKKIDYKIKETKYGKCLVSFTYFEKNFTKIEKNIFLTGYFDPNLKKWFIYNQENITFHMFLRKFGSHINIHSIDMVRVKGIIELDYSKYKKINEENNQIIKKEKMYNYNNREYFYKKPVEHFNLMKLYTYGKRKTFNKKYSNSNLRQKTKDEIHKLIYQHNLYTNNEEDLYYSFEELNPTFDGKKNLKNEFVNY